MGLARRGVPSLASCSKLLDVAHSQHFWLLLRRLACTRRACLSSLCAYIAHFYTASVELLPRGWRAVAFPRWLHLLSCSTWHIVRCALVACVLASLALQAAGRPKRRSLLGHLFFNITKNKRLLRQNTGGSCLYMPQDSHWLASFEVISPPKISFSAAKKIKIHH